MSEKPARAVTTRRRGFESSQQVLSVFAKPTLEVGYVVVDVDGAVDEDLVRDELRAIDDTIKARFLYWGRLRSLRRL